MAESGSRRVWWWLLLFLFLGALIGYLFRGNLGKESERPLLSEKTVPTQEETAPPSQTLPSTSGKEAPAVGASNKLVLPVEPSAEKVMPKMTLSLQEFFHYLDDKPYVRRLALGTGTLEQFKIILKALSSHLPAPAGEGIDPRILTANVYQFFRALDPKDIRLIKEVLRHERDNMEIDLDMFFQWLVKGESDPETDRLRPPIDLVYPYAGFLLNTIGGRAYLFRRASSTRVLLTYYSILIVHQADKRGRNTYGIDIYPFIRALSEEMTHYPDLQYQQEYLDNLDLIRKYYVKKR
ncbi:MAG: hypothetical protein WAL98_12275 [Desulfatiglandaceae bacterium]|jgi:hypothetical protein